MIDEQLLCKRIGELMDVLSSLSHSQEPSFPAGTYLPHTPLPSAQNIEAVLDHMRMQMKYLIFDVDATRRENQYLREMLERRWNAGEAGNT